MTRRVGGAASWVATTWFPVAFPIAYVCASFVATPNPAVSLVRPLLVAVAGTVLLQLLLWAIFRHRGRAAIATALLIMLALGTWVPIAVAGVVLVWLAIVQLRRRLTETEPLRWEGGRLLRLSATVALLFAGVSAAPAVSLVVDELTITRQVPSNGSASNPDVVILLLDGYPRADALADMIGFDNTSFLAALEERGFEVAEHARSNYTGTWATLTSMLHGRYLEDVAAIDRPYPTDPATQYRILMRAMAASPMLDRLRQRGYEVVAIPPGLEGAQIPTADRYLRPSAMTAFELSLVQRSTAGAFFLERWPDLPFEAHRARTLQSLELLEQELSTASERPRLVFAHLISPHVPVVWDEDGRPLPPPSCFPDCSLYGSMSPESWGLMAGQVTYLNRLVLDTVDRILLNSPDSTMVVMSDHGMRRPGAPDAALFQTLFAMRASEPIDVPDDVQPTQVFELILDGRAQPAAYRGWKSESERPLTLTPYTGPAP